MSGSLEDRLRSYYRDRTDREDVPGGTDGSTAEERLHRVIGEADGRVARWPAGGGWHAAPVRIAAVAALVLALLGVGLVVATNVEEPGPSTGPDPDGEDESPVTTTTPSTTEPTTSTTTDSTTTTTTGPPAGTGRTSVVFGGGEMGGWDGRFWVRFDDGWDPTPPGDRYQVVLLDGTITEATSTTRSGVCAEEVDILDVGIRGTTAGSGIGVSGVADPMPRPVEQLDPTSAVYREATTEVMAGLGVDDPAPEVSQVVRSDLDGDGRDEVVVVAQRMTGDTGNTLIDAPPGDYGVVFVRRTDGSQVETVVLDSTVVTPEQIYLSDFAIDAVADLNGDGRMEVVAFEAYYESSETIVYEMQDDGSFVEVLAKGCGP